MKIRTEKSWPGFFQYFRVFSFLAHLRNIWTLCKILNQNSVLLNSQTEPLSFQFKTICIWPKWKILKKLKNLWNRENKIWKWFLAIRALWKYRLISDIIFFKRLRPHILGNQLIELSCHQFVMYSIFLVKSEVDLIRENAVETRGEPKASYKSWEAQLTRFDSWTLTARILLSKVLFFMNKRTRLWL